MHGSKITCVKNGKKKKSRSKHHICYLLNNNVMIGICHWLNAVFFSGFGVHRNYFKTVSENKFSLTKFQRLTIYKVNEVIMHSTHYAV